MKIEHETKFERPWRPILVALAGVFAAAACGGGTPPPPVTPEPAPQASATPASSSDPAVGMPSPDDSKKTAEPASPPKQDIQLEKPTRPPRSLLESADTVYFVSYEESDVGKT